MRNRACAVILILLWVGVAVVAMIVWIGLFVGAADAQWAGSTGRKSNIEMLVALATWSMLTLATLGMIGLAVFFIRDALHSDWRRGRRPWNHCEKCDYDLTGNVSGVCPECGLRVIERPFGPS